MRTVRVEKVAKAANTHCILESWLILSLLNVVLSGTHSRVKGISPNRSPQDGRAIALSWTAMIRCTLRCGAYRERDAISFESPYGPAEPETCKVCHCYRQGTLRLIPVPGAEGHIE